MRTRTGFILTLLLMGLLLAGMALLRRSTAPVRDAERLTVYCAAGLRAPMEAIIEDYERYVLETTGRRMVVDVQYGGSGTLLSLLRVSGEADLFLAGDADFVEAGRSYGVLREAIPLAFMIPVVAVSDAAREHVSGLEDFASGRLRTGIGTPDGTAIGTATRRALRNLGRWEAFKEVLTVTKPTVNDLAGDVRIGALDAAIVFDAVARQYGLSYVRDPALDVEAARIMLGVIEHTRRPAEALHFARFIGAPEHGLSLFAEHGYEVVDGDAWADTPEIMLFSGGINKRIMDDVIEAFEAREGVRVRTVFQGCGGLTAQMRAMGGQEPEHGFPDAYLACDVYYLDPVAEWFSHQAAVTSTRIVIVTARGNPRGIRGLADLAQPGFRIVLGHPTHCTIGALSDRLLHATGLYDAVLPNVVERQPSSGMMVPPVVSGAADASLAYYTDTLPERDRLTVVELGLDEAFADYGRAAQPYGISNRSRHRQLMQRFYEHMGRSRERYEALGFDWQFGRAPGEFNVVAPAGARP